MDKAVTMKTLVIALVIASIISAGAATAVSIAIGKAEPRGVAGAMGAKGQAGPHGDRGPVSDEAVKKLCYSIGTVYSNAAAGSALETARNEIKNEGCNGAL
jgi:hypothetical protein